MTATGPQSLPSLRPALRALRARQVRPARLAAPREAHPARVGLHPLHSTRRRIQYGLVGVVVALTGGLSNALVTANLTYLQGTLGAYATEMAWLPAAYVMTNMSANLLLVKFRQQFGLRRFTEIFLALYAVIAFAHLFVHSLSSAITVRAAHGLVGAALSSLGLYYVIQAFPARYRLKAVVTGLG